MSLLKKKVFVLFLAVILILVTGCGGEGGIDAFAKEDSVNTREELYKLVEEALKNGETEISFETTELDQDDLDELNKSQDGYYGTVDSYNIMVNDLFDTSSVTLYCEISDNYYVENALLYGEEIPKGRSKAKKLKKTCEEILPEILGDEDTEYGCEKRIHDYMVRNVKYGYKKDDKGEDSKAYSSYGALVDKKAVCNGYAQAMKLLCDLSGIECSMIVGKADGENHAWNLVKLDDSWYHVDATWDDPTPDDPERIFYHYFNTTDDMIALDHEWNGDIYPAADNEDYNYFVMNDLVCSNYEEFRDLCEYIFSEEQPDTLQIQVLDYNDDTYSDENLEFLFRLADRDHMDIQTVGTAPCVTLYIRFS
jgi:hypothetical protein